jgi:hypothetical protein
MVSEDAAQMYMERRETSNEQPEGSLAGEQAVRKDL